MNHLRAEKTLSLVNYSVLDSEPLVDHRTLTEPFTRQWKQWSAVFRKQEACTHR